MFSGNFLHDKGSPVSVIMTMSSSFIEYMTVISKWKNIRKGLDYADFINFESKGETFSVLS